MEYTCAPTEGGAADSEKIEKNHFVAEEFKQFLAKTEHRVLLVSPPELRNERDRRSFVRDLEMARRENIGTRALALVPTRKSLKPSVLAMAEPTSKSSAGGGKVATGAAKSCPRPNSGHCKTLDLLREP